MGESNKKEPHCPIRFYDLDRISDTLLFFSPDITLRFNVKLSRKSVSGDRIFFSREYGYPSNYPGVQNGYTLRRDMVFYYTINDRNDYRNNVIIKINDVVVLRVILNSVMNWFVGKHRIFGESPDKKLIIKGKWSEIEVPLNDYQYLKFLPIVITYEDQKRIEGLRMQINHPNNFVDMTITKFMEFYYIICNTDMYACAIALTNYAKIREDTEPQFVENARSEYRYYNEPVDWGIGPRSKNKEGPSFFDK